MSTEKGFIYIQTVGTIRKSSVLFSEKKLDSEFQVFKLYIYISSDILL